MAEEDNENEKFYNWCGYTFDVIAAMVSLLDLATDIIILITWYNLDRMVFFWISVSILICAQFSYIAVFYFNHGTFENLWWSFISIICTIPFSPILSFVFFLVADSDSVTRRIITQYLCCFNLEWDSQWIDPKSSPQMQFLKKKLYKHLGFILEALIEAFPQSILQLTAIVYYNEPNAISIISILISMTSVCSKIFLLSASGVDSIGWRLKFFVWLSFVVDFLGAFFVVSFAFYTPEITEYQPYFSTIQSICLWEYLISIAPFVAVGSLGLHLFWVIEMTEDHNKYLCFCWFLGVTVLWVVGVFMSFLVMWIFTTLWVGFALMTLGMAWRIPNYCREFYEQNCHWILNGSSHDDKVVRLAILNQCIMDNIRNGWEMDYHPPMHDYLKRQETEHYKNLDMAGLRESCRSFEYEKKRFQSRRDHRLWSNIWEKFYASFLEDFRWRLREYDYPKYYIAVATLYFLTFVTGPIYVLSRFFNAIFPLIVVLYLYIDGGIVLFIDVNVFQSIMWLIYVVLMIMWWISAYPILKEEYYLWWIMPHRKRLKAGGDYVSVPAEKMTGIVLDKYEKVMVLPLIEKLLMEKFGDDIGKVVLDYFSSINLDATKL